MDLVIDTRGQIRCIYSEEIDLGMLGPLAIRRASHVEPDGEGRSWADLAPVQGPRLGPFARRSQALAAERTWLESYCFRAGKILTFKRSMKIMASKSYLIDLGNSTDGPIGMVVRVKETSKARAVKIARAALGLAIGDCDQIEVPVPDEFKDAIEYINVYVNPDKITKADICDGETEEGQT